MFKGLLRVNLQKSKGTPSGETSMALSIGMEQKRTHSTIFFLSVDLRSKAYFVKN